MAARHNTYVLNALEHWKTDITAEIKDDHGILPCGKKLRLPEEKRKDLISQPLEQAKAGNQSLGVKQP